ncbi:MAG: transglutaminase family protein [Oscillospiraceae bacterium]|nr:transglutaminase family protein [Oscillospiraceae bacterium]
MISFILMVSMLLGMLLLPTQAANPTSLTIKELASAASGNAGTLESYIQKGTKEANGSYSKFSFPATLTVGSYTVDTPAYTLMAARAIQALGNGKANTTAISYSKVTYGADHVSCSPVNTINKGQYLDLAERVVIFAETTGGAMPTSFNAPTDGFSDFKGRICIYSVVHIFAEVLQAYNSAGKLPDSVTFLATNHTASASAPATTTDWFANVITAAVNVKASMDNKVIPSSIQVGSTSVTPGQFQYLACKVVVGLNAGQTTGTLTVPKVSEPQNPSGTATGQVYREDYVAMAQKIIAFIDTNALAPNYSTSSTIGQMHYYDVIHMYAKVLAYYKSNGALPNYNTAEGWSGTVGTVTTPTTAPTTASTASTAPSTGAKDSYASVIKAAVSVVDYIKSNKNMPSKITVGTHSCTPAQYLYMATQVIVALNNGITSGELSIPSYNEPSNPSESVAAGNLTISEIVTMAGKVIPFMEANGQGPNFMTSSLGTLHYYGGIYLYSQVLSYYSANSKLPASIAIETWFKTTGGKAGDATFGQDFSAYAKYLVPTRNCQSNNATIISVAKTGMMYSNGGYSSPTNTYQAMWNLEKYLNHNTSYIYYANTYRGALGVWRDKGGNCCDMAHLAIACARSLGVPGQYMHGYCIFASMSTGHVYARVYCGTSKGWQIIDTVSNSNYLGYKTNRTAELWNTYAELPF